MSGAGPRVSIGLPVYNGEQFLAAALDSILTQTFGDFELIISDNASTDQTAAICADYAARDARVRYTRNDCNIGGSANFRRVFHLASAPYFKWAAHDDLIAPEFLARCVAVLDADPDVVVCHTRVRVIDADGCVVRDEDPGFPRSGSAKPHERFGDLIIYLRGCYEVLGVIRSRVLAQTPLIAPFAGSDLPLRAELGLRGRFHEIPEHLFLSRDHPQRSIRAMEQFHQRAIWFDPALSGKRVLPNWRILIEYAKSIRRAPLSTAERGACYLQLTRWLRVPRNLKWLAADVAIAAEPRAWDAFVRYRTWRQQRLGHSGS